MSEGTNHDYLDTYVAEIIIFSTHNNTISYTCTCTYTYTQSDLEEHGVAGGEGDGEHPKRNHRREIESTSRL